MDDDFLSSIDDIQHAFRLLSYKYVSDGYFDTSNMGCSGVSVEQIKSELRDMGSRYAVLFDNYPFKNRDVADHIREKQAVDFWCDCFDNISDVNWNMTKTEAKYIVSWVMRIFSNRFVNTEYSRRIWRDIVNHSAFFIVILILMFNILNPLFMMQTK